MKITELIKYLEQIAPKSFQESYDNCGLIIGDANKEISSVLIALDCTEDIINEAIQRKCDLVITHHPLVFSGLNRFSGNSYTEKTVVKAIKNDIAVYAIHTNLDNIIDGVNSKIAQKLGLQNCKILDPKTGILKKLVSFVPTQHLEKVKLSIFDAGAGQIGNYDQCSFNVDGIGTFRANEKSKPFAGEIGSIHNENETRFEVIFPNYLQSKIISALLSSHPYEEVAYDIYSLDNSHNKVGAGIIGDLSHEFTSTEFLKHLKSSLDISVIKFTPFENTIKKVAICGGAGGFLLKNAIYQKADVFVSSDFKYHDFFDANQQIMIADIGHYESEKHSIELLNELILKKFPTFAVLKTETVTNPIKYYY